MLDKYYTSTFDLFNIGNEELYKETQRNYEKKLYFIVNSYNVNNYVVLSYENKPFFIQSSGLLGFKGRKRRYLFTLKMLIRNAIKKLNRFYSNYKNNSSNLLLMELHILSNSRKIHRLLNMFITLFLKYKKKIYIKRCIDFINTKNEVYLDHCINSVMIYDNIKLEKWNIDLNKESDEDSYLGPLLSIENDANDVEIENSSVIYNKWISRIFLFYLKNTELNIKKKSKKFKLENKKLKFKNKNIINLNKILNLFKTFNKNKNINIILKRYKSKLQKTKYFNDDLYFISIYIHLYVELLRDYINKKKKEYDQENEIEKRQLEEKIIENKDDNENEKNILNNQLELTEEEILENDFKVLSLYKIFFKSKISFGQGIKKIKLDNKYW